jgi:hypothetical protein
MSGKTKAELLAEIESLRHQLEVKDDYIGTLEDLLDAETRDTNALRISHDVGEKRYVAANKGRVIAELKSIVQIASYYLNDSLFIGVTLSAHQRH